jgi:Na+/H+ antiporter NhaD/arsenite permease-like protein
VKRFIFVVVIFGLLFLACTALAQGNDAEYQQQEPAGSEVRARQGEEPAEHGVGDVEVPDDLGEEHGAVHGGLGTTLPLWSVLPFVGILLSIAVFPLVAPVFWHHHFGKVSAGWALIFAVPFYIAYRGEAFHEIVHIYLIDYIPFIILLWGLFTASGGILLRGTLAGTPRVNTVFLIIGTILASWMGTTGAAMLLIRPVIRANAKRKTKKHVVIFFIFLVANIGGSLTPLGDPPLFLGFLHGVPFFWTFNILPHMLLVSAILIVMFFIIDSILYRRERIEEGEPEAKEPLRIQGLHNLLFLAGIMGSVLMSGMWEAGNVTILGIEKGIQDILREVLIVLMGLLSLWTTKKAVREGNEFTWFPIKEVAYLFAGIFMTIIPALAMLRAGMHGNLSFIINAVKEPWDYFWITGGLSSFLDNAPTYLTFFNTALGRLGLAEREVTAILTGAVHSEVGGEFIRFLKAISAGAVFFGANTYIGNAPNFMVRSIAEENKIPMPSFFGYMIWSCGILLPVFLVVTYVFF